MNIDTNIVTRYRKKPVIIAAVAWDGTRDHKYAIELWMQGEVWRESLVSKNPVDFESELVFVIPTLEGKMRVMPGDYVVQGVAGEFYPCKRNIFHKTYEEIKTLAQDS